MAHGHDFKDFGYEVKMTITRGSGFNVGGGIIFRSESFGIKLYALTIRIDRYYTLYRHIDESGFNTLLLAGGVCPAVHRGLNQTNRIAVVAKKNNFEIYANEQYVTSFVDEAYKEGKVGVFSYCGGTLTEAVFNDAKVWI